MVLQAQSPAEGVYVRVHDDESAEDVVIFSTENRNVRRRMRFGDMNWAKKWRLHFKYKPYFVTLDADQVTDLVRTSRLVTT